MAAASSKSSTCATSEAATASGCRYSSGGSRHHAPYSSGIERTAVGRHAAHAPPALPTCRHTARAAAPCRLYDTRDSWWHTVAHPLHHQQQPECSEDGPVFLSPGTELIRRISLSEKEASSLLPWMCCSMAYTYHLAMHMIK